MLSLAVRSSLRFSSCRSELKWPADLVRLTFIDYYQKLGCVNVPSSSVIASDDPQLLFINSGMCQFKPIFMEHSVKQRFPFFIGNERLKSAVNSQKCIRASGKHCDFDNIGKNGRHHSFFEMLGNWAFNGHVDKRTACQQAWQLLTDVYGLEKDRLYVTYFEGCPSLGLAPDLETRDIWQKAIGIPSSRIFSLPMSENFWEMGRSGPCGPCTEIMYEDECVDELVTGDSPLQRCTEVWNLVFMQYVRGEDGTLSQLPKMHVDTGMGLERLCRILQSVSSNYDTDLFKPLIQHIEHLSGQRFQSDQYGSADRFGVSTAMRVLADHCRSATVILADGLKPGGQGASHVLRRLLRNAAFQAREILRCHSSCLTELGDIFLITMKNAFPEMAARRKDVLETIKREEDIFVKQLDRAKVAFRRILTEKGTSNVSSVDLFNMYASHGLPKEIIHSMAEQFGARFCDAEFESERIKHLEKSKSDSVKSRISSVVVN